MTRHWFSFGKACVLVLESEPVVSRPQVFFFIHGRFGRGDIWSPLIQRLSLRYRCFSVDLPGFGSSFIGNTEGLSLLEHANLISRLFRRLIKSEQSLILVGHDVGGAVAQLVAARHPQSVSAIVLLNSLSMADPPRNLEPGVFGWRMRYKFRKLFREAAMTGSSQAMIEGLWASHSLRNGAIDAVRALKERWAGPHERKMREKQLRRIKIPVLLLWGGKDSMNLPEDSASVMRELQEVYYFENPDCGHWPMIEDPAWVASKIQEFAFRSTVVTVAQRSL